MSNLCSGLVACWLWFEGFIKRHFGLPAWLSSPCSPLSMCAVLGAPSSMPLAGIMQLEEPMHPMHHVCGCRLACRSAGAAASAGNGPMQGQVACQPVTGPPGTGSYERAPAACRADPLPRTLWTGQFLVSNTAVESFKGCGFVVARLGKTGSCRKIDPYPCHTFQRPLLHGPVAAQCSLLPVFLQDR
jgi:hypothetical protein